MEPSDWSINHDILAIKPLNGALERSALGSASPINDVHLLLGWLQKGLSLASFRNCFEQWVVISVVSVKFQAPFEAGDLSNLTSLHTTEPDCRSACCFILLINGTIWNSVFKLHGKDLSIKRIANNEPD